METRRRAYHKAGFAAVHVWGPTIVRLLQVVAHRFAGLLGIARRQRRQILRCSAKTAVQVFGLSKWIANCRAKGLSPWSNNPVTSRRSTLFCELRRDVSVKLPISGHAGQRRLLPSLHPKENLFEGGNVLLLHVSGDFRRNLPPQ